ncbi:MAG: response regulator [Desulfobacteraceae bacterium]|nr:response regulator [Desulfobacteraceae bacterium]
MEKKNRILIVDDNDSIRRVLQSMLESLGYETETASDGFEALSKLVFDIDLILMDILMPGMDGFQVVEAIRDQPAYKDIPIIMVTGLNTREDKVKAVKVGANDFISKPIDMTEIKVRTTSLLKMKKAQDDLKHHHKELEKIVRQRTTALRESMQDVVKTQRQLQNAHMETIHRLVVAAEFKDIGTATHIKRMSHFSAMLAKLIKLSPSEIEMILHASPLHDIGKIGTPENILLKPGKLNKPELNLIQQHPIIGSQILTASNSTLLQTGEIIAISHHEKWDGTGYPLGLKNEKIPLSGRICAIADVFDALTSVRPYKNAYSNDKALKIMESGTGKHFDPQLFALFTDNMKEVKDIQQRYTIIPSKK